MVVREHPELFQNIIVCMGPLCRAPMIHSPRNVYRRQPLFQITTKNIGQETEMLIKEAIDYLQEQRCTKNIGYASPRGVKHLKMQVIALDNIWKHGTIFQGNTKRPLFPCPECMSWTTTMQADSTNIYMKCNMPACNNTTRYTTTKEKLKPIQIKLRVRLGALQKYPPWEACGTNKYQPPNDPRSKSTGNTQHTHEQLPTKPQHGRCSWDRQCTNKPNQLKRQ